MNPFLGEHVFLITDLKWNSPFFDTFLKVFKNNFLTVLLPIFTNFETKWCWIVLKRTIAFCYVSYLEAGVFPFYFIRKKLNSLRSVDIIWERVDHIIMCKNAILGKYLVLLHSKNKAVALCTKQTLIVKTLTTVLKVVFPFRIFCLVRESRPREFLVSISNCKKFFLS
jgi:hypothetical protein